MLFTIQVLMVDFLVGDSGVPAVFLVDKELKRETEPAPTPLPMVHMEQTVTVLYRRPELVTRDLVINNLSNGNFVKHSKVLVLNNPLINGTAGSSARSLNAHNSGRLTSCM